MDRSSREEQNRYFQGLSGFALVQLSAGLFFTLAVVGVYVSLISFVDSPWWVTLFWAGFTGVFSLLYFFAAIRSLRILPVIIALQIGATLVAGRFITARPLPTTHAGITTLVQATLMLGCTLVGYAIFFSFIKSEGISQVRIQTELALAHRLQQTLVPPVSVRTERFEMYGATIPSDKVGGDLVDCVAASGTMLVYLADVSGHGIPAGVLMGILKAAVRARLDDGIPELLASVNRVLPAVKEPTMYATIACVRLLQDSGTAEYAVGGHHPILHYRSSEGEVSQLSGGGPPVGLVPSAEFPSQTVDLAPGDLLVLFSDGCIETTNAAGEEFGTYRLEMTLVQHAGDPLAVLYDTILDEICHFGPQEDDRSLLVIRTLQK